MGQRGPVGQREESLARPRSRKGSDQQQVTRGELRPVGEWTPDPEWHPISLMIWNAMSTSGQADFYQDSDWAYAYSLCEELSLYKKPKVNAAGEEYHKRSPEMFKALLSGMSSLLLTEADRRRVRIELSAPEVEENPAVVLVMNDYREGLDAGPADAQETA